MNKIRIEGLQLNFGKQTIFENFSHDFDYGKTHVILGRSGCGKSSLIKVLAKLIDPVNGTVSGNDNSAIMFQENNLFEWLTVYDNVALPLINLGLDSLAIETKVTKALIQLGIMDRKEDYPSTLSGGEKQRAAFARTLVQDATLLLLDEPSSALDFETSKELIQYINTIKVDYHKTIIYVTHRLEEAIMLADSISILSNGKFVKTIKQTPAKYGSELYWKNLKELAEVFYEIH